jgi:hypothetical protein
MQPLPLNLSWTTYFLLKFLIELYNQISCAMNAKKTNLIVQHHRILNWNKIVLR